MSTRRSQRRMLNRGLKIPIWHRPRLQNRSAMSSRNPTIFWLLVIACAAITLWQPSRVAAYPFTLMATIAHEWGHAISAILLGGSVDTLIVTPDLGGLVKHDTAGTLPVAIVSASGLIGPSLVAGLLIIAVRNLQQSALALLVLSSALFLTSVTIAGDTFTQASTFALGLFCALVAFLGYDEIRNLLAQTLAIFMGVNAVSGLDYAFAVGGHVNGQHYYSDTAKMEALLGGPHWFWGTLLCGLAFMILAISFSASLRRNDRGRG